MGVTAIVVTFNHRELLEECLESLTKSDSKVDNIIVVDNDSTDGTNEFMKSVENEVIIYKKLDENIGGAGGFNKGIAEATKLDNEYIWIMDDDSMVQNDSLSALLEAAEVLEDDFGFLSSDVVWTDGTPSKMNVPKPVTVWNEFSAQGLVKVERGTFVSMLTRKSVVKQVGLPIKEFFIWNDDTEYSLRISQKFSCYYVEKSVVLHKMAENHGVNIVKEESRIPRYFYGYRNRYYIARKLGYKEKARYYSNFLLNLYRVIFKAKFKSKKLGVMFKGYFSGLFFHPKIEMVDSSIEN